VAIIDPAAEIPRPGNGDPKDRNVTMTEEHHVALPRLYGAPAYARPPRPVEIDQRPPNPDDLPLEAFRTKEEQVLAAVLAADDAMPGPVDEAGADRSPGLQPRPFRLRALGRLIGGDS
jgi:hypothetical protein